MTSQSMPTSAATPVEMAAEVDAWPPLELYDVFKRWRKDQPLIEKVNMTVDRGQVVWMGGANGAGKTTMLRIIAGLIDAQGGEVRAYGLHPVRHRRDYQRRVGFLAAGNTGIYARLTVQGQLDCWARVAFVPRENRAERVERTLERFGLIALRAQRSDRLSMGQRQRLRIAMTFIADRDLVLLDEPRNSLDGEGAAMLAGAVRETADRGGAVIWVSPTGELVDYGFDARYILEAGQLKSV
jgi:ABC-2 type transport system ATP-binding protein